MACFAWPGIFVLVAWQYCDYRARHKSSIVTHELSHSDEKPYKCEHCDYRARAKSTLITHERVHDVDKPYKPRTPRVTGGDDKLLKCPHCDYTAGRSNMIKHERIHSGAWFFDVSPFSVAPVLCCAVLIHRCSFVPRGRAVVVVWLDVVVVALECCVVV